jgi:hypothetical protein
VLLAESLRHAYGLLDNPWAVIAAEVTFIFISSSLILHSIWI